MLFYTGCVGAKPEIAGIVLNFLGDSAVDFLDYKRENVESFYNIKSKKIFPYLLTTAWCSGFSIVCPD